MRKVTVKKQAVEKIKKFFPWIYMNEIKKIPKDIRKGEIVDIYSPSGELLGRGYINPSSVITVRILSFFNKEDINKAFFIQRIKRAFSKRQHLQNITNAFRIVHSEADFLPGLIVDYYDGYLSLQINTAGIENFREEIIEALIEVINPKGIYEKSDEKSRGKEGLDTKEGIIYGSVPESIFVVENSVKFKVSLFKGQKTGFYLDQRRNRKIVSNYVEKGFKVLDLFSNTGGFGIYCGLKEADFIKFVDISENAVELIHENCELNSINNYQVIKENVFDFLKEEVKKGEKYDIIVVDPPSFAKTKKEKEGALRGFKYLILKSLQLLSDKGYIAIFSCSHHVDMEDLKSVTLEASKDRKVPVEIVEHMYQDTDHPYILNIPNSLYLKGFILRKGIT